VTCQDAANVGPDLEAAIYELRNEIIVRRLWPSDLRKQLKRTALVDRDASANVFEIINTAVL
jgi:hypothetical protein